MQQGQVRFLNFSCQGTRVRTRAIVLASRDIVQTHPQKIGDETVPSGVLWRPNRQLAEDTQGKTTHARYDDLYDLLRAGRHTVQRYGAIDHAQATETTDLLMDIATVRRYVRFLLMLGLVEPEERKNVERIQSELIRRYDAKRNERKITARERFRKGLILEDRTGRKNPPAAAMVSGAGIGHLLNRVQDVRSISMVIDQRTLRVFGYIEEHLELYHELWNDLRTRPIGSKPGTVNGQLRWLALLAKNGPISARRPLHRLLAEYRSAFSQIVARPFCRNAFHVVKDLETAMEMNRGNEMDGLMNTLERIRRGIRWTFVLHALQTEVIAPLAYLLDELRRGLRRRGANSEAPENDNGAIKIKRSLAPERFAAIEESLRSFLRRLERCSDDGLTTPIKHMVDHRAALALNSFGAEEWSEAKSLLLEAAKLL